jgi:hypothetical protein
MEYDWHCVPGRDADWAATQKKNLGERKFRQEHLVEFIGSIDTVINKETLEKLFFDIKEPQKIEMQEALRIYERPIASVQYCIGWDPSKGTGMNDCAGQVLKIISMKPLEFSQVAVFKDDRTNVYKQADIINKLSLYYNNAYICIENNGEGAPVVQRLWWDLENEFLVNDRSKVKKEEIGLRATMKNKPKLVLFMKKLVEDGLLHLVDKATIEQMATYIEWGGSFKGKDNMPDDCVCALYWACWFAKMDILDESYEMKQETQAGSEEEDVWGIIGDDDSPNSYSGSLDDGMLIDF